MTLLTRSLREDKYRPSAGFQEHSSPSFWWRRLVTGLFTMEPAPPRESGGAGGGTR